MKPSAARADEPPSPPTERLSAGRQLNAIFALALLAAPSVAHFEDGGYRVGENGSKVLIIGEVFARIRI